MLHFIVAALAPSAVDAGGSITANWGNITITRSTPGISTWQNSAETVTFSGATTRIIKITHTLTGGSLQYSISGAAYVNISSGDTFMITSGQTLRFKFTCGGTSDQTGTVTVRDNTLGADIDTFDCSYTYEGA